MSTQGFDTWIVEVRGAGLSSHNNFKSNELIPSENVVSDSIEYTEHECQNGSTPGQKELDIIGSRKELDVSVVEGDKANTQTPLSELQSASQLNDALEVINEKISDYLSKSQSKVVLDDLFPFDLLKETGLSDYFDRIIKISGKKFKHVRRKSILYCI